MVTELNTVSAYSVLDLRQELINFNLIKEEDLTNLCLTNKHLLNHKQQNTPLEELRVHEREIIKLWNIGCDAQTIPHIGLLIGQRYNPETRGVLANWLFQCSTLNEAMGIFSKHIALLNPSERWTIENKSNIQSQPDLIELTYSLNPNKGYPQAAIERSLSALMHWSKVLSGKTIIPITVNFKFKEPSYIKIFKEVFGNNINFSQKTNSILLKKEDLELPILTQNKYLKGLMNDKAHNTLNRLKDSKDITVRVKNIINNNLIDPPNIQDICLQLNLSRPTLYRHLKKNGTHFSELILEAKKERARNLMSQGESLGSISYQLGFTDVSSFHKAFKRWFGVPPGQYR